MPEHLTHDEINSQTDPSVAKQYDNDASMEQQLNDYYSIFDGKNGMLNTYRDGIGAVGRSMHVAKRSGPDLLFLANQHSRKFEDLSKNKEVQFTVSESTGDWVSITGTATTTSNSDPRIKEVYSKFIKAWFGDLGDGKHDGSPDDPRLALIEVKAKYASYYKKTSSTLGFVKEVGVAVMSGDVAVTGVMRELNEKDLEEARKLV